MALHYDNRLLAWMESVLSHDPKGESRLKDVSNIPPAPEYYYPDVHEDFKSMLFELGSSGFKRFCLNQAERRFFLTTVEASRFMHYIGPLIVELESCETWVHDPLSDQDIKSFFELVNAFTIELLIHNNDNPDVDEWDEESKHVFRRLGMCCICILAWQHYTPCVQFIYRINSTLRMAIEELLILFQEDVAADEYPVLFDAAQCLSARVSHFENIMHSAQQGLGRSFHRSRLNPAHTAPALAEPSPAEVALLRRMIAQSGSDPDDEDNEDAEEGGTSDSADKDKGR